ncbi:hypothetical protein GSI_07529 [Ganoderma sinense ZZ0214-1]|uniref:Uncharacterized protein n=1 Tax=Ganoderma sinense ZZ0214-1 TaxID=1077348 RepID=A0A2G8S9A0_9APHY|nr:hypothetical protein GSI_07529 [Ganoderma sinense ZZ0214-1]
MDSSYFTAQALYQFGARALGMGHGQLPQRREMTSGSSEADSLDSSAMDIEPSEPTGRHFGVDAGIGHDGFYAKYDIALNPRRILIPFIPRSKHSTSEYVSRSHPLPFIARRSTITQSNVPRSKYSSFRICKGPLEGDPIPSSARFESTLARDGGEAIGGFSET